MLKVTVAFGVRCQQHAADRNVFGRRERAVGGGRRGIDRVRIADVATVLSVSA
jgi:hypothetical protein